MLRSNSTNKQTIRGTFAKCATPLPLPDLGGSRLGDGTPSPAASVVAAVATSSSPAAATGSVLHGGSSEARADFTARTWSTASLARVDDGSLQRTPSVVSNTCGCRCQCRDYFLTSARVNYAVMRSVGHTRRNLLLHSEQGRPDPRSMPERRVYQQFNTLPKPGWCIDRKDCPQRRRWFSFDGPTWPPTFTTMRS